MQTQNLELKLYETKKGNFVFNYKGLEMVYIVSMKKVQQNKGTYTSVLADSLQYENEFLVIKLEGFWFSSEKLYFRNVLKVRKLFPQDFFNQCEFIYKNIELRKLLINTNDLQNSFKLKNKRQLKNKLVKELNTHLKSGCFFAKGKVIITNSNRSKGGYFKYKDVVYNAFFIIGNNEIYLITILNLKIDVSLIVSKQKKNFKNLTEKLSDCKEIANHYINIFEDYEKRKVIDTANEHNIKLMLNNFDVFKNDVESILYSHYEILPF